MELWHELTAKYEPRNEYRRRDLERQLDRITMKPGTDPDIFISNIFLLADKIKDIGGNITRTKITDIVLQGLTR